MIRLLVLSCCVPFASGLLNLSPILGIITQPKTSLPQSVVQSNAVAAGCTLPEPVPDADFPPPLIKVDPVEWTEGSILRCPNNFIAKFSSGSKAFSLDGVFECYSNNGYVAWTRQGDGYALPPFASCGIIPDGIPYYNCSLYDAHTDRDSGVITLWPGHEAYCPTGEVPQYDLHSYISMTCSESGLQAVDKNGIIYTNVTMTQCVSCDSDDVCTLSTTTTTAATPTAPNDALIALLRLVVELIEALLRMVQEIPNGQIPIPEELLSVLTGVTQQLPKQLLVLLQQLQNGPLQ